MPRWIVPIAFLALATAPASAAQETPEDALAACVIGKAAVLMHQSAEVDTAFLVAWDECKPLVDAIPPDPANAEMDTIHGIQDYVYSVLYDIAD